MRKIESFLTERPPSSIFHYTTPAGVIGILRDRKIWGSEIQHLNDSTELRFASEWMLEEWKRQKPNNLKRALNLQPALKDFSTSGMSLLKKAVQHVRLFVTSFSLREDLLSQWRAYCAKGNGYSIGFDATSFLGGPATGTALVKCVYTKREREDLCRALIEGWAESEYEGWRGQIAVEHFLRNCLIVLAAIKDASFVEEQEWRLVTVAGARKIKFRSGRHGIVPYIETPIDVDGGLKIAKVWIGPNTNHIASESAVRVILNEGMYKSVSIKSSETPYRG